jgi:hypothetical protein
MGHILITVEDETPMLHFAGETPEETEELKDLFARWLPLWQMQVGDLNCVAELVKSQGMEWVDAQIAEFATKGGELIEDVGTDGIGTGCTGQSPESEK